MPVLGKPLVIILDNPEFRQESCSNLVIMPVLIIVLESGHLEVDIT